MLRTECELDEKVPPSPPETLVQGLGPLDSPLSIGFEAQCMSHVAMACPACLHTLMLRHDCTHRTCIEIDVLMHSDESHDCRRAWRVMFLPETRSPHYRYPRPTTNPTRPSLHRYPRLNSTLTRPSCYRHPRPNSNPTRPPPCHPRPNTTIARPSLYRYPCPSTNHTRLIIMMNSTGPSAKSKNNENKRNKR